MYKRDSSKMFVFRQLRDFLEKEKMVLIYESCVRSMMEYAAPLLVELNVGLSEKIEKIQRRAHSIICRKLHCDCVKFVPLSYRRKIIGYRLFQTLIHDATHPLHHLELPILRHSRKYQLPVLRTSLRSRSFIISMSKLFNSGFL